MSEIIDEGTESIDPAQVSGFAFPIPLDGIIQNLQISADLFINNLNDPNINDNPLTYTFTVLQATSAPNDGTSHPSSQYLRTAFTGSITFGPGLSVGNYYAASNLNFGPLVVSAGDRIA